MKIETWNVTTLKNDYSIDILTEEFRRFELDLLGVSETNIPGAASMTLGDIKSIYSGRKDGVHRQGVGYKRIFLAGVLQKKISMHQKLVYISFCFFFLPVGQTFRGRGFKPLNNFSGYGLAEDYEYDF